MTSPAMTTSDLDPDALEIKQRYANDCFLCCIAMALGLDYDTYLSALGKDFVRHVAEMGLVGRENIDRAFDTAGARRNIEYRVVQAPQHPHMLEMMLWKRRALLQVTSKNFSGRNHIVYWDGVALRDPSTKLVYRELSECDAQNIWLFDELALSTLGPRIAREPVSVQPETMR